jgi:hypothetical protein
MGKIFSPPKEFCKPEFGKLGFEEYEKIEKEYASSIVEWTKKHGKGTFAGELVRFQVADGFAQYVVFSLKPVQLIHLPVADGYQFPYANRLTAEDIKEKIDQEKRLKEMFKTEE